ICTHQPTNPQTLLLAPSPPSSCEEIAIDVHEKNKAGVLR
ncbi:unnamed protein product, partial [Musa acuminata subsp. burmannicoides]